ncbi:MAP kinase-interacting serine/threonine-protein kinase mnk-1-like [Aplysia californica]|uniref:MAP kinase-interacting serine/threonine-protein kinase mnk-1-like n=1 Tax=Aplysia californica TaxID=6500 RepID=A0ABM0ZUT5_APLCA|nr:MAP kinase-interacting serine/threonine-protein kinase mnk-1-like [Aplysia californica]
MISQSSEGMSCLSKFPESGVINAYGDSALSIPRTDALCVDTNVFLTYSKKKDGQDKPNTPCFNELYQPTGEILGHGSFGSVCTYKRKKTGMEYAVKIIKNCDDPRRRPAVLREIRVCGRFKGCENIIQLVEFFEEKNTFYLVFDKVAGGTMDKVIKSQAFLDEPDASRAISAIARALLTLHSAGVAHRDIKHSNILVHTKGEVTPLVLCDLGLASEPTPNGARPSLTTAVGSPKFMAPEVVAAIRQRPVVPYDHRCDMWSLGVLLFSMLYGFLPFKGDCGKHVGVWRQPCHDCHQIILHKVLHGQFKLPPGPTELLSRDAVNLVRGLLAVDPRDRYSAFDVLQHPFVTAHAQR